MSKLMGSFMRRSSLFNFIFYFLGGDPALHRTTCMNIRYSTRTISTLLPCCLGVMLVAPLHWPGSLLILHQSQNLHVLISLIHNIMTTVNIKMSPCLYKSTKTQFKKILSQSFPTTLLFQL